MALQWGICIKKLRTLMEMVSKSLIGSMLEGCYKIFRNDKNKKLSHVFYFYT